MRVYLINARTQEITEGSFCEDLSQLADEVRAFIGGWMEVAFSWPNGDVIYVDEEGLLKLPTHFFKFRGRIFAGNGVVTAERGEHPAPPTITIEELRQEITFHKVM